MKSLVPLILLTSVAATAPAAPETWAASLVGVSNSASPGTGIHPLDLHQLTGAPVSASASASFTGLDRSGASQTMSFSGTATDSAEFGRLRSKTSATLANSYYNAANPVYVGASGVINPAGSPDSLTSLGFAGFNDTLQFGGNLPAGYRARYIFHIDGTNSGTGFLGDLSVQIGADPAELLFLTDAGFTSTTWSTSSHEVNGITGDQIHVQFSTQVVFDAPLLADGGSYSGMSDFSATATLSGIELTDANGVPLSGWSVTSASGTQYPVAPVPEPASLAALGAGLLVLARRRRGR